MEIERKSRMSSEKYNKTLNVNQDFYILNTLSNNNNSGNINYDKESKLNNYNLLKSSENFDGGASSSITISSTSSSDINNNNNDNELNLLSDSSRSCKNLNARRRWKLLSRAIISDASKNSNQQKSNKLKRRSQVVLKKSKSNEENDQEDQDLELDVDVEDDNLVASTRRFDSFDLIQQDQLPTIIKNQLIGPSDNWFNYKLYCDVSEIEYNVNVHHIDRPWTAKDLIGFNNTGNITVWPSEEALSYFVLGNLNIFKGHWILELGGGMTCLSGLMLAKYGDPYLVHMTDGNALSVENVKKTIRLNDFNCFTKSSILKWEQLNRRHPAEHGKYHFILSADCIFFDDSRNALIDTIDYYLAAGGQAFIMAPKRGHTMNTFVTRACSKGFKCEIFNYYNKHIWNKHLELLKTKEYNEDIHYPILIKMARN